MFYRLIAIIPFKTEETAKNVARLLKPFLKEAPTIKPDQPNEERPYFILERCYHDESPTKPCQVILDSATIP